jgi:asparagine synthase (glutamine-hydrolysing)
MDELYLSAVIKWGYCPDTTRTPYNEIKHVLPGEHVVLNYNGVKSRKIVDPLIPRDLSEDRIKMEIDAAVKRRVLSSDVPVGILVSGGLDSSIVYTLAKRYGDVRPYFASTEAKDSEKLAVDLLLQGVPYTTVEWNADDLTKALHVMQEPIDLGSLLPQCALSNAVQEDVCLTGDGADEVFGGYGRSERYDSQWSDIYHELVAWHLPRLDRIMMRNCIEVRSPFLARRVVEGAMGLPHSRRQNKNALRDMFRKDLPVTLADQPKMPLRSERIKFDREANSQVLVDLFRSWH